VRSAGSGVLLVDKSAGPTSHDVVELGRRALSSRKVGHTGTLDPFATGLLVLCVGRATRLSEYFHIPAKRYEAEVTLGVETSSHDSDGEVVTESESWSGISAGHLESALRALEGRIEQRPPSLSAKKIDGQRAHRLARAGADVSLPAASVMVHSLKLSSFEPPVARVSACVSTGTYVRSLARDLGRSLGCGAHLSALRRTAIDDLHVREAITDRELESDSLDLDRLRASGAWLEPAEAMSWLPVCHVDDEGLALLRTGRSVSAETAAVRWDADGGPTGGVPVRVLHDGHLIAIAEEQDGSVQPRKVFVA
jgi:tRNA pseudouridine55 synthase